MGNVKQSRKEKIPSVVNLFYSGTRRIARRKVISQEKFCSTGVKIFGVGGGTVKVPIFHAE